MASSGKYNSDNIPATLRTKVISLADMTSVGADAPTLSVGTWADPSTKWETPAANGGATATRTCDLKCEFVVPELAVTTASLEGDEAATLTDITVRISAQLDPDAPLVSHALDLTAKKSNQQGGVGSELCTTAQQTITDSWAEYSFTVDGSGLAPGDLVALVIRMALNDTGGSTNHTMQLGGIEVDSYERR
jgi:hypothetical protein